MAKINKKIENIYPLTPLQEGMLFHSLYNKNSTAYVVQNVFSVDYNMEPKSVEQALKLLSDRHSVLRTSFVYEGIKDVYQVVLVERFPEVKYYDFSGLDNVTKRKRLDKIISDDLKRGFDLKKDTLLRAIHIRYDDGVDKLVFNTHHIIADGWCIQKVFKDFYKYYSEIKKKSYEVIRDEIKNEKKDIPDYGKYIKWLMNQDKEKARKFWKKELDGYESNCEIKPMDKPSATEEQMRVLSIEVNVKDTEKLKKVAERSGSTINTVAEIAVGIMLQKYSGNNDVVYGKVVSGRNADIPGIEDIVGLFINTIPVRVVTETNDTAVELIKKQQKKSIESTNYDYYSLADIQGLTAQGTDLIKVIFVFENYNSDSDSDDTVITGITSERSREQTNYGISISSYDNEGRLCFNLMYDPNIYSEEEIKLILERLKKICEEIANKPDSRILDYETVTDSEYALIVNDFNATSTKYSKDKTVVELFEEQVKKTPDNIALVFEDQKLTYAELNERINSLAHKLREFGVKPDDFVAIIADRSIEMICGIYGIIKAGGAYVPVDPTYPEDRINYMFEDCQPKAAVVYTSENVNIPENIKVIDMSDSNVWNGFNDDPELVNKPSDLAYCIYTSGTTGTPKGTMLEHHGVVNLKYFFANRIGINSNDRVLQFANYIFDASVWEMAMALLNGAALVCVPTGLAQDTKAFNEYCTKNEVTVATLPPNYYVQEDVKLNLRLIITAGSESNKFILEKSKNSEYINAYGPTETTVCATYWKRPEGFEGTTAPIGVPVDNFQTFIMNGDSLCGIGVPGELCIAGDGLARGYLNRPELTAEKFVKNPYGDGKMYRSGDLARWLPNGNIEYLGRIDEQVKIRGFRIELGEIESKIREIEVVKDCAVIAKADSTGDKAIYAYYTSDAELSVSDVRDRLNKCLPEYMVPAYMMQIEAIPVTRNGKLDKRALPEIESKATKEYVAPRNENEEIICNAFCEVLGVESVGIYDDFFELGGNSIKAMSLVRKLQLSNVQMNISDVMQKRCPCYINECIPEKKNPFDDFNNEKIHALKVERIDDIRSYLNLQCDKYISQFKESNINVPVSEMQKFTSSIMKQNIVLGIDFYEKIEYKRLTKAVESIINKQEALRCKWVLMSDPNLVLMNEVENLMLPIVDVSGFGRDAIDHIEKEIYGIEHLTNKKLLNFFLIVKYNASYYKLYLIISHVVFDGMSCEVVKSEIIRKYYDPLYNVNVKSYLRYISDLNKQAMNISEDELISKFSLREFSDLIMKNDMELKEGFNIKRSCFSLKEKVKNISGEEIYDIAYKLYVKMQQINFDTSDIAFAIMANGRNYGENKYYDTIGEFIDILPVIDNGSSYYTNKKITELINYKDHNCINFLTLLNDKKMNSCFPKIFDCLKVIKNTNRILHIFNYLGVYDFNINDVYDESIKHEMNFGTEDESIVVCNAYFSDENIYLDLWGDALKGKEYLLNLEKKLQIYFSKILQAKLKEGKNEYKNEE